MFHLEYELIANAALGLEPLNSDKTGNARAIGRALSLAYATAMYFTALGLLGKKLAVELAYLGVGAALSAVVLFSITTRIISSLGATDGGELQILLAAGLAVIGTAVGAYSAWRFINSKR